MSQSLTIDDLKRSGAGRPAPESLRALYREAFRDYGLKEIDLSLELKFDKFYVGLAKEGQVDSFVSFRPRKNFVVLDIRLPQSDAVDSKLAGAVLDPSDYNTRWRYYPIHLDKADIIKHSDLLKELVRQAYDARHG